MSIGWAALFAVSFLQSADTTVAVREGMRLDLRNPRGEIRVSTWDRNSVRITSERSAGAVFTVEQSGSVLRVRPMLVRSRRRGQRPRLESIEGEDIYLQIIVTVPVYLDLVLRGLETDIVVRGTEGSVTAETVEGSVDVTGGRGFVSLESHEKAVYLTGARGRVRITSGEGDVVVRDLVGELSVEAVDGNVDLAGIQATVCEATTVEGNVTYQGNIADEGRYVFSTHDGDVTLVLPSDANATVSVTNYDGVFETAFPVILRESRRKQFQFVLGTGQAEVELAAFDGDIFLRRSERR